MKAAPVKKPVSATELWFCGALLGVVALCFALMGYLEEAPKFERLRSKGITVQAQVLRKINFSQPCEPTRKGIARTCRVREFHVRYLDAKANDLTWRYGSLNVSQAVFDTTQEGQKVQVVFLREGTDDLQLSHDVENYSPFWYVLLGVFGSATLVFCTFKAMLAFIQDRTKKHA